MTTYGRDSVDISTLPTKRIPQATRFRVLMPPLPLTPADVRKIVEDPDVTGPIGLDPEMIGVVRRLWRHFNSHGCA